MSYSISHNSGTTAYGVQNFLLDEVEDLQNLPNNSAPGSVAFIISTSQKFMLNNKKVWIQINNGGGGDIDPDVTYVYDGGTIK